MSEPQPWTKIFQRVKTQIPSASDAVIRQEVFNTMIDFTQDTNMWLETVEVDVQPNLVTYPLTITVGQPFRLMVVYKDGDPQQNWADSNITMRIPGILQLARAQPEAVKWWATIAKTVSTPLLDTDGDDTGYPAIDDWIVDTNNDVIFYGVMWFLQRQPAKPYRDPNGAKENGAIYQSQKSQARINALRSNVYNGQAWRYPQSFATISRKGWQ
jgi:hypothetical protein